MKSKMAKAKMATCIYLMEADTVQHPESLCGRPGTHVVLNDIVDGAIACSAHAKLSKKAGVPVVTFERALELAKAPEKNWDFTPKFLKLLKTTPTPKPITKGRMFKADRILGHWCVVFEDANRLPIAVIRATRTRGNSRHIAASFNTILRAEDAGTL